MSEMNADLAALVERMRLLLNGQPASDQLLAELLCQAQEWMLCYTGQPTLPALLKGAQVRLAITLYNRLGSEGERARHEGGLTLRFEGLDPAIQSQLMAWRLARV